MKYEALKRKKKNEEKHKLETEIDKIQNTSEEENFLKKLEALKEELQTKKTKKMLEGILQRITLKDKDLHRLENTTGKCIEKKKQ